MTMATSTTSAVAVGAFARVHTSVAAVPETFARSKINGADIAFHTWGRPGPRVTLLAHGLSANGLSAEAVGRSIASHGGYAVACDFRGRNQTPDTGRGTCGWQQHARDLLALAKRLHAKSLTVIGHSMGAYVTMELALLARGAIDRVVLVDGLGHIEPGAWKAVEASPQRLGKTYASADTYIAALRNRGIPAEWERQFREDLITNPDGTVTPRTSFDAVNEDLAYTRRQLARPNIFPSRFWQGLPAQTLVLRASAPLVPAQGNVISSSDLRFFKTQYPSARVITVPHTNHYSVFTDPKSVAAIGAFMERAG